MTIIQSIVDFMKTKGTANETKAPESICPNCWGRSEYGGKFYNHIEQKNLDINSKDANVGWVQDYANKHLQGIVLKKSGNGNELICDGCKTSFQAST